MMREVAASSTATFILTPWWLKRVVTVHPLGGCPMGTHAELQPVVNEHGASSTPRRVLRGLRSGGRFGDARPGRANPTLTIAALADRFAGR